MLRTKHLFGFVLMILLLVSCKPRNVLSREEMADVLYDIHLTEASLVKYKNAIPLDWSHGLEGAYFEDLSYESVLKKHHLTQDDFFVSVSWYSKHLKEFSKVYDLVMNKCTGFLADIELGRFDQTKDTTQLNSMNNEITNQWRLFKNSTYGSGMMVLPKDSIQNYLSWFIGVVYPKTVKKDTAVYQVAPWIFGVDSVRLDSDSLVTSSVQIKTEVDENSPTKNNVIYPKNSHFVDFTPVPPRRPSKRTLSTSEDDKIRERFRSRIKEQNTKNPE